MSEKSALVVDDSKSARFALRKYLENLGYKVDAVEGANEAYVFLQSNRPRVIFLDHVMPGIDGFEALAHIKGDARTTGIPVVICSSNDGAEFCADARTRGALDILCKPPSTERLASILENLQNQPAAGEPVSAVDLAAFDLAVEPPAAAPIPTPAPAPAPVAVAPRPAAPAPAPVAAAPAPVPSKVSVIREPEVAIEQAVMKALRGAMQQPAAAPAAAPPNLTPVPPPADFNPNATGSFNLNQLRADAPRSGADAAQLHALRDQMETRLKKLNQDMFLQIAELKAAIANMEGRDPGVSADTVAQISDSLTNELHQRISAIESAVSSRLSELAQQFETRLAEQTERIAQIVEAAKTSAAQEAEAVAERTMLSAATRIAEQLAEPLLKAHKAK